MATKPSKSGSQINVEKIFSEKGNCPYCGMPLSRFEVPKKSFAICGWCNISWSKQDTLIIEKGGEWINNFYV